MCCATVRLYRRLDSQSPTPHLLKCMSAFSVSERQVKVVHSWKRNFCGGNMSNGLTLGRARLPVHSVIIGITAGIRRGIWAEP